MKKKKVKKNTRITGAVNEELAAIYLLKKGFNIVRRNYRKKNGEIDIIAYDGEYLVFCEVKYRETDEAGGADYSISEEKKKQIARIARVYMSEENIHPDTLCRFDCVLVYESGIKHIENAWQN